METPTNGHMKWIGMGLLILVSLSLGLILMRGQNPPMPRLNESPSPPPSVPQPQQEHQQPIPPGEKVKVPPTESPPAKLTAEQLLEWYPKGKMVRNLTIFNVKGRGQNKSWMIKGVTNFVCTYTITSETEVLVNDPKFGRLIFQQSFQDVVQHRAISDKSLELALPSSPILDLVWVHAEGKILNKLPVFKVVREIIRGIAAIVHVADPNLKRTLTQFAGWLEAGGAKLTDAIDVEFETKIDKLSGTRLEVEYITGLGVVSVTQRQGPAFSQDELEQLAHASTLLMDYFIFPAGTKQVGETWSVRAQDVCGLAMPVTLKAKTDGELTFKREKDDAGDVMLNAVKGSLTATQNELDVAQKLTITVDHGMLRFSPTDKIVRDARIRWNFSGKFESRDYLLFGTEKIRDLQVDTRYEAKSLK